MKTSFRFLICLCACACVGLLEWEAQVEKGQRNKTTTTKKNRIAKTGGTEFVRVHTQIYSR